MILTKVLMGLIMKMRLGLSFQQYVQQAGWLLLAMAILMCPADVRPEETDDFIQQWQIDKQWTGDFDGMVKRRKIRVLVVHNKMMFFFDKARIRGLTYEAFREFETYINKKLKLRTRKIKVVFLPVPRDPTSNTPPMLALMIASRSASFISSWPMRARKGNGSTSARPRSGVGALNTFLTRD